VINEEAFARRLAYQLGVQGHCLSNRHRHKMMPYHK
jgi:hypothetical protein